MERKVGEVFNFKGEMLQVKDTGHDASCNGCYFNGSICTNNEIKSIDQTGWCIRACRTDDRNVIFVEVRDDKEKEYQQ